MRKYESALIESTGQFNLGEIEVTEEDKKTERVRTLIVSQEVEELKGIEM